MPTAYGHTNLVAHDWRALCDFYVYVFGCVPVGEERDLAGPWLDAATGLTGARIRGRHLRLPGHGDAGPTLEIFGYDEIVEQSNPTANRAGFGHLAFRVDDVAASLDRLLGAGGSRLGEIAQTEIEGRRLSVVYARDPEGNILELQRYD